MEKKGFWELVEASAIMLLMPLLSPGRADRAQLRGLHPTDARVLDSLASDHRMVVVQAK